LKMEIASGLPREVDPARRPDRVRVDRVLPVEERVRPPRKRPDENARVATVADDRPAGVRSDRSAEVDERSRRIAQERRRLWPAQPAEHGPEHTAAPGMVRP